MFQSKADDKSARQEMAEASAQRISAAITAVPGRKFSALEEESDDDRPSSQTEEGTAAAAATETVVDVDSGSEPEITEAANLTVPLSSSLASSGGPAEIYR